MIILTTQPNRDGFTIYDTDKVTVDLLVNLVGHNALQTHLVWDDWDVMIVYAKRGKFNATATHVVGYDQSGLYRVNGPAVFVRRGYDANYRDVYLGLTRKEIAYTTRRDEDINDAT